MMKKKHRGFSLLETMLVTVIMVLFAMMAISYMRTQSLNARIERTSLQMQQILQAATSYYIDNNAWPTCNIDSSPTGASGISVADDTSFNSCQIQALIDKGYLQDIPEVLNNPWGQSYETAWSTANGQTFLLRSDVSNPQFAIVLQGSLPLASVNSSMVQTTINIPSYVYDTALAMKNVAIYTPGQSIPAPTCPSNMEPQVKVVPVVISGTLANTTNAPPAPVYSVYYFYAFAQGDTNGDPIIYPTGAPIASCESNPNAKDTCASPAGCWTACVKGDMANPGGKMGTYVPPGSQWSPSSLQITATTFCAFKSPTNGLNSANKSTSFFKN